VNGDGLTGHRLRRGGQASRLAKDSGERCEAESGDEDQKDDAEAAARVASCTSHFRSMEVVRVSRRRTGWME
jgi:hypothetical protein